VPDDVAEASLNRFVELRLIDDAEFARMWVRSRHEHRGLSRRALRHELVGRGVASEDIDEALTLIDDDDEIHAAWTLARRKAGAVRGLPAQVQRRRMMAALQRKGYSAGLASRVVSGVLGGGSASVDDDC
jgi:regulatory protein